MKYRCPLCGCIPYGQRRGFVQQVMNFFHDNPEETLFASDAALKFGTSSKNATNKLHKAAAVGLLRQRERANGRESEYSLP